MPFIDTRAFAKDVRLLYQSFMLDMILLKSKEMSFASITSLTMSSVKRF